MTSALDRLAALDAERSSVLLRALREQNEVIAALSTRVAQLEGWRAAALDETAALRTELRRAREESASGSSNPSPASIVIRSASGALAMRRRITGSNLVNASSPGGAGSPPLGLLRQDSISSLEQGEEIVIELVDAAVARDNSIDSALSRAQSIQSIDSARGPIAATTHWLDTPGRGVVHAAEDHPSAQPAPIGAVPIGAVPIGAVPISAASPPVARLPSGGSPSTVPSAAPIPRPITRPAAVDEGPGFNPASPPSGPLTPVDEHSVRAPEPDVRATAPPAAQPTGAAGDDSPGRSLGALDGAFGALDGAAHAQVSSPALGVAPSPELVTAPALVAQRSDGGPERERPQSTAGQLQHPPGAAFTFKGADDKGIEKQRPQRCGDSPAPTRRSPALSPPPSISPPSISPPPSP